MEYITITDTDKRDANEEDNEDPEATDAQALMHSNPSGNLIPDYDF